jgi:NTE family protein
MATLPGDVTVHVLPTGAEGRLDLAAQLRYRDASRVAANIERACAATADYLRAAVLA